MASSAYKASFASLSLVLSVLKPNMATLVTSLPVPQVVGIRISLHFFSGVILPKNKSERGVICFNANNLDISNTVPPPIPIILS